MAPDSLISGKRIIIENTEFFLLFPEKTVFHVHQRSQCALWVSVSNFMDSAVK
jgi:hypothetical protein